MTKNLLDYFFKPESVAVVGASSLEGQVGRILLDNLREGGFPGEIFPVTPEAPEVLGLTAYASLSAVGRPTDLAVICTPVETAPAFIRECGAIGTRAAVIVSAENEAPEEDGAAILQAIHEEAQKAGVHFFGPDCMGLLCPESRLNASLAAFSGQARQPGLHFPERLHGERYSGVGHPEQHRFFPFHQRGHHGRHGSGRSYRLPGKRDQR